LAGSTPFFGLPAAASVHAAKVWRGYSRNYLGDGNDRLPADAQMKIPISRSTILNAIVIAILVAALPGSIQSLLHTGNFYLFSQHFFRDMLARLSGPGRLRFILQPSMATLLGARDGVKDARVERPPFLWAMTYREHRHRLLRHAFQSIQELIAVAILLDMISQFLIFRTIHPGAALVLGPVLIGAPYAVSRGLANRIWRDRYGRVHQRAQADSSTSRREQHL
jgi:hypothetical protein